VDRRRLDAHFVAGAVDSKRDLAAIGDEDLVDRHRQSTIRSGWSNSTGWPSTTSTWRTVPERGAGIGFITFIASMMRSVSPSLTFWPGTASGLEPGSGDR